MMAAAVIGLAVRGCMGSGMSHAVEFLLIKQFAPEAAVKALGVAVLPSAARFNVKRFDNQRGQATARSPWR
jgi:hypothetical protein